MRKNSTLIRDFRKPTDCGDCQLRYDNNKKCILLDKKIPRGWEETLEDCPLEDVSEYMYRSRVLLKAAYDLLNKQKKSVYVLNLLTETAVWDEADCDGYCLMEEIAELLGVDEYE